MFISPQSIQSSAFRRSHTTIVHGCRERVSLWNSIRSLLLPTLPIGFPWSPFIIVEHPPYHLQHRYGCSTMSYRIQICTAQTVHLSLRALFISEPIRVLSSNFSNLGAFAISRVHRLGETPIWLLALSRAYAVGNRSMRVVCRMLQSLLCGYVRSAISVFPSCLPTLSR